MELWKEESWMNLILGKTNRLQDQQKHGSHLSRGQLAYRALQLNFKLFSLKIHILLCALKIHFYFGTTATNFNVTEGLGDICES